MDSKLLSLFKMHLANLYANVAFPIPLIPLIHSIFQKKIIFLRTL